VFCNPVSNLIGYVEQPSDRTFQSHWQPEFLKTPNAGELQITAGHYAAWLPEREFKLCSF
jgi:hypothetical protein